MTGTGKAVLWGVVILVVAGVLYLVFMQPVAAPTNVNVTATTTTSAQTTATTTATSTTDISGSLGAHVGVGTGAPMAVTVTYDGTSFSPQNVTIKKGGTITWKSTGGIMEVASAMHPTHTVYDGTSRSTHCTEGYTGPKPFDQCAEGSSYSYTFVKAGEWKYHNHEKSSAFGKVTVVE